MLLVSQPLGVFWHFVHDHFADHLHAAHDDLAIQLEDSHAADHDGDHSHLWVTPAEVAVAPRIGQPQAIHALCSFEDASPPSAPPFPPFSPPRA
jgi:hypothetical protein